MAKKKYRTCIICGEIKPSSMFNHCRHKCKECEHLSRCSSCHEIKDNSLFAKDLSRHGGISHKCKECTNIRLPYVIDTYGPNSKDGKRRITPVRRSHMFFKDCRKRMGATKYSTVWDELGYSKESFLLKFPKIDKDQHLDHCIPLSWFLDNTPLYISCAIENLQLLPSDINISKSNKYADIPESKEYLEKIFNYIRPEYKNLLYLWGGGRVKKIGKEGDRDRGSLRSQE